MRWILAIFLLFSLTIQAQQLVKPSISPTKLLNKTEQVQVKKYLKGKIFKELAPAKFDYKNKYDRGTVYFNPEKGKDMWGRKVLKARNYSFHKVIIPDGTVIEGANFSQKEPHTQAIQGKYLTFKHCNLVNVKLDPTWTIIDCNTAQIKRVVKKQIDNGDGTVKLIISHQVEKEGKFVEVSQDEEIVDNKNLPIVLLRYTYSQ